MMRGRLSEGKPGTRAKKQRGGNERLRPKHLDFIRSLPCVKCGRWPVEGLRSQAAHVRVDTDGSAGKQPSDRFTVPLCAMCHLLDQHWRGEGTFWGELGIDPVNLSARLWAVTGDFDLGLKAVETAWQRIALNKGAMTAALESRS